MKKALILLTFCSLLIGLYSCSTGDAKNTEATKNFSFYEVPLVCGAAPEIGCGSRLKPLFIDAKQKANIKEAWSNRQGTVIAFEWNNNTQSEVEREKLIEPIFKDNMVKAELINKQTEIEEQFASLNEKDKWYKGMDVDKLSIEEAGVIAATLTHFAKEGNLISEKEEAAIKTDIEDYFKKELVQVRTFENLNSDETQEKWKQDGYQIYVNHIGKERADKVSELYHECEASGKLETVSGKSCCETDKKDCCKKL